MPICHTLIESDVRPLFRVMLSETSMEMYGPVGFGVVAVLVLWRVILGPQLQENKERRAADMNIAQSLFQTAEVNREISILQLETAKMLRSIVETQLKENA